MPAPSIDATEGKSRQICRGELAPDFSRNTRVRARSSPVSAAGSRCAMAGRGRVPPDRMPLPQVDYPLVVDFSRKSAVTPRS
jgi:hypothetical protein